MSTFKKTLVAICTVAAVSYGVRSCKLKPVPAPTPADFKTKTIERVMVPNMGEATILSNEKGLVNVIRLYDWHSSNLKDIWVSNDSTEKGYALSPEAQQYAKDLMETSSKLAYELARIKHEADAKK